MAFRNYKLVGKKERTTSEEAFQFYRKRAKHRDKPTHSERRHSATILNTIYDKVKDAAIEYEGGVYAPSFFYIVPQPFPSKAFISAMTEGGKYRKTMNLHTGGLLYSIIFVNILPEKRHRIWDMTNGYFTGIRKKLSDTLKSINPSYIFSLNSLRKVL